MNLETFHFLRPAWLWALLLLIPFGWSALRRTRGTGAWERLCDPRLLPHLVAQGPRGAARWTLALLAIGWSAAAVALAGPAWERLPQQTFREPARTVFVLTLGDTMNGRDVRPSRLARARHKLLDAVGRSAGGSVALVAVREEAYAVTPLTDDANVLREVVPLLDTRLMPGRGVHPARGIEEALRLLEPTGARGAGIVLVTDGADDDPDATAAAVRAASDAGAHVSVLAVAGLDASLEDLARRGGGAAAALAIDDGDLDRVLAPGEADPLGGARLTKSGIRADEWKDMGAWLVWIPVAIAPFAFRRGWAAALAALLFAQLAPAPARAAELDAFQRPDQRGARAFAEGRYEESAQAFEDPAWQAAARYRAGDYAGAAEVLAPHADAASQYNLGNALAKAGRLEDAVAAYDRALAAAPADDDARFNRDLVKKLLDDQKQQSQPQPQRQQQQQQQQSKSDAPKDGSSGSSGSQGTPPEPPKPDGDAGSVPQASQPQDSGSSGDSKGESADGRPEASPNDSVKPQAQGEPQDGKPQAGQDGGPQDGQAEPRHDSASAGQPVPDAGQGGSPPPAPAAQDPRGEAGGQPAEPGAGEPPEPGDRPGLRDGASGSQDQEHAQWMARLPDDPGGLLREKIRRDYLRKQAERRGGE